MKLICLTIIIFISNSAFCSENGILYDYPAQQKLEIDGSLLGKCLMMAAHDSSLKVSMDVNDTKMASFNFNASDESLIGYLMAKPDRKYDWTGGHERELKTWILAQKDNSIDPVILFSKSLELSKGNIWNALLSIHQTLRVFARYYETKYYNSDELITKDDFKIFWNKFIDIRGDLVERNGPEFNADHQGSWYRIWGMMILRARMSGNYQAFCHGQGKSLGSRIYDQLGDVKANSYAILAEVYKALILMHEQDLGKAKVNTAGAKAGIEIGKVLQNPVNLGNMDELRIQCADRNYLRKSK